MMIASDLLKNLCEDAGVIAVELSPDLDAKEQAFFIAGFQEAIKYLMHRVQEDDA